MLIEDISKDMDIANLICQILGTDVTHAVAQVSYLTSTAFMVVKPTILCCPHVSLVLQRMCGIPCLIQIF